MSIFTLRIQRECNIICLIAPAIGSRALPDFVVCPLFYIRLFSHVVILIISSRFAIIIDGGSPLGLSVRTFHSELITIVRIIAIRQSRYCIVADSPDTETLVIQFYLFL